MTLKELVEQVAVETVDVLGAIFDDGIQVNDLLQVIEAGTAWQNAWSVLGKLKEQGIEMTKEEFILHIVALLPAKVLGVVKPIPDVEF